MSQYRHVVSCTSIYAANFVSMYSPKFRPSPVLCNTTAIVEARSIANPELERLDSIMAAVLIQDHGTGIR